MRFEVKFDSTVSLEALISQRHIFWRVGMSVPVVDFFVMLTPRLACIDLSSVQEHPEFADASLVRNPLLYTFVKSFLGTGALEVDTHSSVTSLPGAPNQHWHHDTGNLFDVETWPNQNQHAPPHGRSEVLSFVQHDDDTVLTNN